MHLEVFVPKPKQRSVEIDLHNYLDWILTVPTISRTRLSEDDLVGLTKEHRELFKDHDHQKLRWENVVYGYSSYAADGYFMSCKTRGRELESTFREITLVFKFIITNYTTTIKSAESMWGDQSMYKPSDNAYDDQRSELKCMEFHYEDTRAFITQEITRMVLRDEEEIWSHVWYSRLTRKVSKNIDVQVPIHTEMSRPVPDMSGHGERVIYVCDYCSGLNDGRAAQ